MMRYGQPRRINVVSVSMFLIGVAVCYLAWCFLPTFFNAWSVDHVLQEAANSCYHAMRVGEDNREAALDKIVDRTKQEITQQVGIRDDNLDVELSIDQDSQRATVTADYHVTVDLPYLNRKTTLAFHRARSADLKEVPWD